MKKLKILFLSLFLCLTGCTKMEKNKANEKLEEYETYYDIVMNNKKFTDHSDHFDIALEMSQIPDGSYRYAIVVDNAQIAMYDIVMIAVADNISYQDSDRMMPSLGIFEDTSSLVPGQVNKGQGLVKGLAMSGETDKDSVNLKILVQYKNTKRTKEFREFFSYHLDTEGYSFWEEEKE